MLPLSFFLHYLSWGSKRADLKLKHEHTANHTVMCATWDLHMGHQPSAFTTTNSYSTSKKRAPFITCSLLVFLTTTGKQSHVALLWQSAEKRSYVAGVLSAGENETAKSSRLQKWVRSIWALQCTGKVMRGRAWAIYSHVFLVCNCTLKVAPPLCLPTSPSVLIMNLWSSLLRCHRLHHCNSGSTALPATLTTVTMSFIA